MKNLKWFLITKYLQALKYLSKKYYAVKYYIKDLFKGKQKIAAHSIYEREEIIAIDITNSSDKKEGISILSLSNAFLPDYIKLSINGCLKQDLLDTIFQIKSLTGKKVSGLRYHVSTANQLSNIIEIKNTFFTGGITIYRFRPLQHKSAHQNQSLAVDAPLFNFKITNGLTINLSIEPGEKINLFLTVKDI